MGQVLKPIKYEPLLDMKQTEQGIKLIKDFPHQGSGRRQGRGGSFTG